MKTLEEQLADKVREVQELQASNTTLLADKERMEKYIQKIQAKMEELYSALRASNEYIEKVEYDISQYVGARPIERKRDGE